MADKRSPEKIAEEMAARMRESFGFDLRGTAGQQWLSNCIGEIIEDAKEDADAMVSERNGLLDGAMLAAGMGHRLTRTQATIMHDEIVRLRSQYDYLNGLWRKLMKQIARKALEGGASHG